jgi:uncharacterized membrane protein YfcA
MDTGLLLAATFVGAFVQAATGFGFAILAAPAFLVVIGEKSAVPLLVLLHIVQSAMLVPSVWRQAPAGLLRSMLIGVAVGAPIGLMTFLWVDLGALKLLVGVVILAATALLVAREAGLVGRAAPPSADGPSGALAVGTGAGAGFLTSLLVMPGPPLMVYLSAAPRPRQEARALSLTMFAVCYTFVALLNAVAGTIDRPVLESTAVLAAAVVAGTLAGSRTTHFIGEQTFRRAVLALLAASGAGAIWSGMA